MQFAIYTDCVSPHQFPIACELANILGVDNFRNVYHHPLHPSRAKLGWNPNLTRTWEVLATENKVAAQAVLEYAKVLMSSVRDIGLFRRRASRGLFTIYYGERLFRPKLGMLRMLKPSYFKTASHIAQLLRDEDNFIYYAMGIHAAYDMIKLCALHAGNLRSMVNPPRLQFENKPCGVIKFANSAQQDLHKFCLDKIRIWGYNVAPSKFGARPVQERCESDPQEIKVLWVGRLLNLKRVDTIVRAVGEHANLKRVDNSLPKISLNIYGTGPEEDRLRKMAAEYGETIRFYPPVSIEEVRVLMRNHDVYVMASNAHEGWGAVVNEALEEGMRVVGTYEAGSSATILPETNLFHAGDWRRLLWLLSHPIPNVDERLWSVKFMAKFLVDQIRESINDFGR